MEKSIEVILIRYGIVKEIWVEARGGKAAKVGSIQNNSFICVKKWMWKTTIRQEGRKDHGNVYCAFRKEKADQRSAAFEPKKNAVISHKYVQVRGILLL
ncbi:hypothetical protein AVEN_14119-1 [Araneus ventricosus]|uniref:Uncharacterized protein n=1 Tax=Araneus ventricosus TaxID=182803 RepID=A0A4Y2U5U1_ARAVE|nr:hypothetical protein AVEN_4402-1 [Araneus ventricosus]GBO07995.1 hypothetical protein AVEN_14119-1 [Araneus ventricosus]